MQYEVTTPDEYLNVLEKDWRRDTLVSIRDLIRRHAPDLKETINYKMLNYEDARGSVFALNAQKGYVSLYVGDAAKVDPSGELLEGLSCGKGCIRFMKSVKVSQTRIDEFIARAADVRRRGGDVDC
jgi:hypothetical protein